RYAAFFHSAKTRLSVIALNQFLPESHRLPQTGSMIIGEHGAMLLPHVAAPRLLPRERFSNYRYPEVEPDHHYHQFIQAVRGEREASAPFSYGGSLTEVVLMGTVAQHLPNQTLAWDAEAGRFDHNDANALLARPYREGWEIDGLSSNAAASSARPTRE
ncbi:MAG: hypothetical protein WD942_03105, partial [Dehalococcoidia bacterium]